MEESEVEKSSLTLSKSGLVQTRTIFLTATAAIKPRNHRKMFAEACKAGWLLSL
jgi:hypothetical protein